MPIRSEIPHGYLENEPLQGVGVYRQERASGTTPAVLRYANGRTAHTPRFTGITVSRHRGSASTT